MKEILQLIILVIISVEGGPIQLAKWLPYKAFVLSHGAVRYWSLSDMTSMNVIEEYTKTKHFVTEGRLLLKAMMNYECEDSNALSLLSGESRVDNLLPAWYNLPLRPGFTIDGFVRRSDYSGTSGTILSSWGMHAERWKLFWLESRLTFRWSENGLLDSGDWKTCTMMNEWTNGEWTHFAVRYSANPVAGAPYIQFFVNGIPQDNDPDPIFNCGPINRIVSNLTLPLTLGATYANATSNENLIGDIAKVAIYHRPISDARIRDHYLRLLVDMGPCHGHGTCDAKSYKCMCFPLWFGENCTNQFYITSVYPQEGSYYGMTPITIEGYGFENIDMSSLHVRIGPSIMEFDKWAGAKAVWSGCTIIKPTNSRRVVCVTDVQKGRSPQNVSLVFLEASGVPANRPVFSQCNFSVGVEECYFHPSFELTPRVWSYPRWAIPGSLLNFTGQNFVYDNFTFYLGPINECKLDTTLPFTDTYFSCRVDSNIVPNKAYTMTLVMLPMGGSFPMKKTLYVHSPTLTIYPLYPVEWQRNPNCPKAGFTVQLFDATYHYYLNETQIRVYEAPCYQRRTEDFMWLKDKVPINYWETYGYSSCPPTLANYMDLTYVPSAFTLHNTFRSRPPPAVKRKQRRFVDYNGHNHCLMMEVDRDT